MSHILLSSINTFFSEGLQGLQSKIFRLIIQPEGIDTYVAGRASEGCLKLHVV